MPNLASKKVNSIYGMFKGEPGTRKSTSALSFPTPQYWFDMDGKINSLILPARNWGIDMSLIDYDTFSRDGANIRWNKVIDKLKQLQMSCKYKTVILDSVTTAADAIGRQIIENTKGPKKPNEPNSGTNFAIGGINVNSLDHYKAEAAGFTEMISLSKDIQDYHNCNIILIAHVVGERKVEDKANAITHMARIIITGGKTISGKIPAYCDETYHFNVWPNPDPSRQPDYGLYTIHTGEDYARTALPLPNKIIFNNDKLYDNYIKPAMDKLNQVEVTA
jgi:hypothetical protein